MKPVAKLREALRRYESEAWRKDKRIKFMEHEYTRVGTWREVAADIGVSDYLLLKARRKLVSSGEILIIGRSFAFNEK